jgi:1,2-dihydroxy-3-keto-5-methylthiopentene dioxygenase
MINDLLAKRSFVNQLIDYYGPLLTTKQQQLMTLYYGDDLSLSEIALSQNISRTAVSDALKQSVIKMMSFERHLNLVKKEKQWMQWVQALPLSDMEKKLAIERLEQLLKKFENVHTHTEDEVRAITAGKGIFIIKGSEEVGYFDVELQAGDVISVPENKPHFFTLMENKQIVAVRLFIETEGWIAHPYADAQFLK